MDSTLLKLVFYKKAKKTKMTKELGVVCFKLPVLRGRTVLTGPPCAVDELAWLQILCSPACCWRSCLERSP